MKSLFAFLFLFVFMVSCKSDKNKNKTQPEIPKIELSVAQKIANAHGFENWNKISEVQFTFAVDRDTIKGNGRSWTWLPKKDSVVINARKQEIKYSRKNIDSVSKNADRAFINDKFWAFVPFQLIWDNSATISETKKVKAPISNTELDMITILYANEGGYTPGDAYDIYYDKNYMIKEWTFRKGNSDKPSLSTTFENYVDYNGIKIATNHKKDDGKWDLNLTEIVVKTD